MNRPAAAAIEPDGTSSTNGNGGDGRSFGAVGETDGLGEWAAVVAPTAPLLHMGDAAAAVAGRRGPQSVGDDQRAEPRLWCVTMVDLAAAARPYGGTTAGVDERAICASVL